MILVGARKVKAFLGVHLKLKAYALPNNVIGQLIQYWW